MASLKTSMVFTLREKIMKISLRIACNPVCIQTIVVKMAVFLDCYIIQSGKILPLFQRFLQPPSLGFITLMVEGCLP